MTPRIHLRHATTLPSQPAQCRHHQTPHTTSGTRPMMLRTDAIKGTSNGTHAPRRTGRPRPATRRKGTAVPPCPTLGGPLGDHSFDPQDEGDDGVGRHDGGTHPFASFLPRGVRGLAGPLGNATEPAPRTSTLPRPPHDGGIFYRSRAPRLPGPAPTERARSTARRR